MLRSAYLRFSQKNQYLNRVFRRNFFPYDWVKQPLKYDFQGEEPTPKVSTLSNGMRVATLRLNIESASVGVYIDAGSRNETSENNGTSHFLEHMALKGTTTRSRLQLEREAEQNGIALHAYTSRETTTFLGRCLRKDVPKVINLWSDVIQRPLLSQSDIEMEKRVIVREMQEIDTQLDEVIFDMLHTTAYRDHPLGFTILGPKENVLNMKRTDLEDFITNHYTAPNIVLICVGNVEHEAVVEEAAKHFSTLRTGTPDIITTPQGPPLYIGAESRFRNDDMPHAHCIFSCEGCSYTSKDLPAFMIASMILGNYSQSSTPSKGLPSRLAREVAENDGAHSFQSFNICYKDSGLWGVYFVTERAGVNSFCVPFIDELHRIRSHIQDGEVQFAKNALKTYFLNSFEDSSSYFDMIGKDLLNHGRCIPLSETEENIDAVTVDDIHRLMTKCLEKDPVIASLGNVEQIPQYNKFASLSRFNVFS